MERANQMKQAAQATSPSSDLMYREHILDHYKNPRNYGSVAKATLVYRETNPLCGDEIEVSAQIKNEKVHELKFKGHGCAISQAAASLMVEELRGKSIEDIERFSREHMLKLLSIQISPMRMKCALLARHVLLKGLVLQRSKDEGKEYYE